MRGKPFEPIRSTWTKSGLCPVCGRRVRRSKTFEQTLNPFNRNALGEPKTRDQIWDELRDKGRAWVPDFTHWRCTGES